VSIYKNTMLTDNKIKNLKSRDKPYPTADGHGLAIYTLPSGAKSWRLRYRFNKKADMLVFGKYPLISIKDARELRDEYLGILARDINPKDYQKQQKALKHQKKLTFREAFDTWFDRHKDSAWTPRTAEKQVAAFEKHIFPHIGDIPVEDIKTPDMLRVLRMMDDKGITVTLKKVKGWSSRVFKDCVVTGVIDYDPIVNIDNTHFKKHVTKHYATVTSEDDIKELLLTLETYKERGTYPVATALSLAPYLMLRPSEVSKLTWKEIDFKNKMIRIGAERMKMTRGHLIPMSNQVLVKFKEIKEIKDFKLSSEYVFPSPINSHTHINAESLRSAIRSMGISRDKFTTHGFRSMASTRLNEMGFNGDWVEVQLSHKESNSVREAYNNAVYIEQRKDMMQQWSDYLDKLKDRKG